MEDNFKKDFDIVFFGTEGVALTSTSAEHVSNLAKELVRGNMRDLEALHFTKKTIGVIGADTRSTLRNGVDEQELAGVENKIKEIGEANSLIAWLREGIKSKNSVLNAIKHSTREKYCEWVGKKLPDCETQKQFLERHGFKEALNAPEKKAVVTEEEIVAGWKAEDRIRYTYVKEAVATYDAMIEKIKAKIEEVKQAMVRHSYVSDEYAYEETPSVDVALIEESCDHYSAMRKNMEAELVAYTNQIQEAIMEDTKAKESAYESAKAEYRKSSGQYNALVKEYNDIISNSNRQINEHLRNEYNLYCLNKLREVGSWKIVIPAALKDIYNKVVALGK